MSHPVIQEVVKQQDYSLPGSINALPYEGVVLRKNGSYIVNQKNGKWTGGRPGPFSQTIGHPIVDLNMPVISVLA